MFRQIWLLMLMLSLIGCASRAETRLQNRLAELDAQYKAGAIDAVQYQAKYSAEVAQRNSKREFAGHLVSN